MEPPEDERRFFRRMDWIKPVLQLISGVITGYSFPDPKESLDWWVLLAILFCVYQLVGEIVAVVGFRFWRKAFGHRYYPS